MSTQQKIVTFLAMILFSGIGGAHITFGQALLYRETTEGKDFTREMTIDTLENGYLIKTTTVERDEMTYYTDPSFSFLKWEYHNPENGTDISAERLGNTIFITGQFKNEKYEGKLRIDDLPWYQDPSWGIGLRAFVNSDKNSTCFWAMNPNNLRIYKFEAKKEGIETIEVNGRGIESVYVRVTMAGWMKVMWHGDIWFRKSDGTYVFSKIGKGPRAPVTTVQLIREK